LVQLDLAQFRVGRNELFQAIQAAGVQLSVPYRPVHTFRFYQKRFAPHTLPEAEAAFQRIFALPLYPLMSVEDVAFILETLKHVLARHRR